MKINDNVTVKTYEQSNLQLKLANLISKNNKNSTRFFNSDYMSSNVRKEIIHKTLHVVFAEQSFKKETVYLCIAIIDSITSKYWFDDDMFEAISLVCLRLALKLKEKDSKYLSLSFYEKKLETFPNQYNELEKIILKMLDFNLNIITPYDYINVFFEKSIIFEDINIKDLQNFANLISLLTYCVALEYDTNQFQSLAVAVCIIMVARHIFKCKNILCEDLEDFTGLSKDFLEPCYDKIMSIYKNIQIN